MSPKTPDVPATPRLPDPESPEVIEARRKAQEAVYSRTGRRSTILT
jgi:hypothetical protein